MQQAHEIVSGTGARPKTPKRNEECHKEEQDHEPSRDRGCCAAGDGDDENYDLVLYAHEGDCKHPLLPDCSCGKKKSTDELVDQWSKSKTPNRPTTSEDQSQESATIVDLIPAPMKLLQLIKDKSVATLLEQLPHMVKFLPYAGAVLAVANMFIANENHKAIIQWFEKLSDQIENVKRELVNMIKMDSVRLRYGSHIVTIQTAINLSVKIAKASDDSERKRYIDKFKDLCSGEKLALAMNNLIAGLTGKGPLQIHIMDRYYETTSGHLPRVKSLAKELLQLVYGGLMVLSMYETLMHDERFAEECLRQYNKLLEDVKKNIQDVFDRCKNEFRDNMLKDLNKILDSNVSNTEAVTTLSSLMSEKYDWLENYCIVCKKSIHMDFCFKGNYVHNGRNGKLGAVFYKNVTETAVDLARQREIETVISGRYIDLLFSSATGLCKDYITILHGKGIETHSCAVIWPKRSLCLIPYFGTISVGIYRSTIATLQQKGTSSNAVVQCGETLGFNRRKKYFSLVLWNKVNTSLASDCTQELETGDFEIIMHINELQLG